MMTAALASIFFSWRGETTQPTTLMSNPYSAYESDTQHSDQARHGYWPDPNLERLLPIRIGNFDGTAHIGGVGIGLDLHRAMTQPTKGVFGQTCEVMCFEENMGETEFLECVFNKNGRECMALRPPTRVAHPSFNL